MVSSESGLQAAIASATPGTLISVKAGTYSGQLSITRSGTATAPIVVRPYGDGAVKFTANLPTRSCNASGPDPDRTLRFRKGASFWTFADVTIDGGVYIAGRNVDEAHAWFKHQIDTHNWQARRSVPGRGSDNPKAAAGALNYLAKVVQEPLAPSDGIVFSHDVVTRKGMFIAMSRYGTIDHTTVQDVACGSGPGIWLISYSDGWKITNNRLSNIKASSFNHYMQEAVRIDGASNYNTIESNVVTGLPTDGRAFTDDQDASYNDFLHNTAQNVFVGFSEEMSGWGNKWIGNKVTAYRGRGFDFGAKDAQLQEPSKDSTPYYDTVQCNYASGSGRGAFIAAVAKSSFSNNSFGDALVPRFLRAYWVAQGNTWDGRKGLPPLSPARSSLAGC